MIVYIYIHKQINKCKKAFMEHKQSLLCVITLPAILLPVAQWYSKVLIAWLCAVCGFLAYHFAARAQWYCRVLIACLCAVWGYLTCHLAARASLVHQSLDSLSLCYVLCEVTLPAILLLIVQWYTRVFIDCLGKDRVGITCQFVQSMTTNIYT